MHCTQQAYLPSARVGRRREVLSRCMQRNVSVLQTINRKNVGFKVLRTIKLLCTVYVYDEDQDEYRPLPDMPEDLPLQIYNARKALALIDAGETSDC